MSGLPPSVRVPCHQLAGLPSFLGKPSCWLGSNPLRRAGLQWVPHTRQREPLQRWLGVHVWTCEVRPCPTLYLPPEPAVPSQGAAVCQVERLPWLSCFQRESVNGQDTNAPKSSMCLLLGCRKGPGCHRPVRKLHTAEGEGNCQGYPASTLPARQHVHTSGCKDLAAAVLMEQIPLPPSLQMWIAFYPILKRKQMQM